MIDKNDNFNSGNFSTTNRPAGRNTDNGSLGLGDRVVRAVKEWVRKQIVKIKHRPSMIPMFWIVVTMLVYTLGMNDFSRVNLALDVTNSGLISFWATLLSILVCVLYMNVYPKRQKMKVTMLVLTFVFFAALIVFDVLYYIGVTRQLATGNYNDSDYIGNFYRAQTLLIVHIVFVGVSILLCALLPLYTRLIWKIDTSIELEKSPVIENAHVLEELEE